MADFLGIGLCETCAYRIHVSGGLHGSHTWLEMPECFEDRLDASSRFQRTLGRHLLLVHHRHEEVRGYEQQRALKLRRRDPNDGVRVLIELNNPANDAAIVLEIAVPIR